MDSEVASNMVNNSISQLFNNKIFFILIILGVVGLFFVAYYVYTVYVVPTFGDKNQYMENKELIPENSDNTENYIYLYLWKADWCPHCTKITEKDESKGLGAWEQIKEFEKNSGFLELEEKTGYKIKFVERDGDDETSRIDFQDKYLNKNEIEGYPSIYLIKDDQVVEFDANPTLESLRNFIVSVV